MLKTHIGTLWFFTMCQYVYVPIVTSVTLKGLQTKNIQKTEANTASLAVISLSDTSETLCLKFRIINNRTGASR